MRDDPPPRDKMPPASTLTGQELAALVAPGALQRLLGALERGERRLSRQARR